MLWTSPYLFDHKNRRHGTKRQIEKITNFKYPFLNKQLIDKCAPYAQEKQETRKGSVWLTWTILDWRLVLHTVEIGMKPYKEYTGHNFGLN
jgi:hypothetical protein